MNGKGNKNEKEEKPNFRLANGKHVPDIICLPGYGN